MISSIVPFQYNTLSNYYTSGVALGQSLHAETIRNGNLSDFFARDRLDITPPWDFPPPSLDDSSQAILGRILSLKPLIDMDLPSFNRSDVDSDFKKLFALHQGLGRMKELSEYAQTLKGEALAPILDKTFQGYMEEVRSFLGEIQFDAFANTQSGDALSASLGEAFRNFQDGLEFSTNGEFVKGIKVLSSFRQETITSTIDFEAEDPIDTKFGLAIRKNYEGAVVATSATDPIAGVSGAETFAISITENNVTTSVLVDLSNAESTSLSGITSAVNSALTDAGFDTFAKIKEHASTKFGLEFSLGNGEVLSFSTSEAPTPAAYITGRAGTGNLSQGFLSKTDDLSSANPNPVFYKEVDALESFDSSNAVAVDSNGFVYTVGVTNGTFDGQTNDNGTSDAFLQKFDHSGTIMFTRLLGSASDSNAFGIAIDSADNVLITGQTYGQLSKSSYGGNSDTFVTKFNSEGQEQWTRQLSPLAADAGLGVTTDSSNNVYTVGFSDGAIGSTETLIGGRDAFLNKLSSNGDLIYDQQIGSAVDEQATAVVADSDGNIWIAGHSDTNGFLKKYNDSDGNPSLKYNLDLGPLGAEGKITGVVLDSSGDVFVAGTSSNSALSDTVVNSHSGALDAFIIKVDDQTSTASEQFVSYSGTSADDAGSAIAIDLTDNGIYVAGHTDGLFSDETRSASTDGFLTKFSSTGAKQYDHQFGSAYENRSLGITLDLNGTSILSMIGMPNGSVPPDDSNVLVARTSVRADQSFTININKNGPERVTIENDDTLRGLTFKINNLLGNNGKAFIRDEGTHERLIIKAQNGSDIVLNSGPSGFDALPGLGLKPTRLIAPDIDPVSGKEVETGVFELGLGLDINVATKEAAADAFILLDAAQLKLRNAFDYLTIGPSQEKPVPPTGTPPAFLTKRIGQLQVALDRLSQQSVTNTGGILNVQI